jgi:Questin oxidase-like
MLGPTYTVLDEALERLAPFDVNLVNGNANHAPMVIEALCALGRPDAALPWVERYRPRLLPRALARRRIEVDEWQAALGRRDAFPDWSGLFSEELEASPWREVLDRWGSRLAPGLSGAATHGIIRTGHAVRALAQRENPVRLRELADALASWAATYNELPGAPAVAARRMSPRAAVRSLPIIPAERRRSGNITAALDGLSDLPEFAPAIGLIDIEGDLDALVAEFGEIFARIYLANVTTTLTLIAFIHGVTSLHAIGNILPQVSDATGRRLTRYGWQAGCGLYACFGNGTVIADAVQDGAEDTERLIDQAVMNGDEHAIKFTEACLRFNERRLSPAFGAAVRHALGAIGPR